MADALIGYTGFVGGNLLRQRPFQALFNSKNIAEVAGQSFDLLVCSGMPAAKWIANKDPDADLANMRRLLTCLKQADVNQLIVISTVDVYPKPQGVDEASPIDAANLHPYGRHRLMLEDALRESFDSVLIVRLPGLFGAGLKKNAIFDLLHNNQIDKIHSDAVYQWYNLGNLWRDIQKALAAGLTLVNFATEPIAITEMAEEAFGFSFTNRPPVPPARYDFHSKYADLFGGKGGYLYDRRQVLAEIKAFVDSQRATL